MRAGELINGYRLLEDFTVVGAGLSRWTFAERDGRQYFLKEFLSPTYPDDDAPGSPHTRGTQTGAVRRLRGAPPRDSGCTGTDLACGRQPGRHARLLPLGRQVLQGH